MRLMGIPSHKCIYLINAPRTAGHHNKPLYIMPCVGWSIDRWITLASTNRFGTEIKHIKQKKWNSYEVGGPYVLQGESYQVEYYVCLSSVAEERENVRLNWFKKSMNAFGIRIKMDWNELMIIIVNVWWTELNRVDLNDFD